MLVSHSTETVTYLPYILYQVGWYTRNSLHTVPQIFTHVHSEANPSMPFFLLVLNRFKIRVLLFLPSSCQSQNSQLALALVELHRLCEAYIKMIPVNVKFPLTRAIVIKLN